MLLRVPPDDLASRANILMDPAEIHAASMDDVDEDEDSGAAQVECFCYANVSLSRVVSLSPCVSRGRWLQQQWAGLCPGPAG